MITIRTMMMMMMMMMMMIRTKISDRITIMSMIRMG